MTILLRATVGRGGSDEEASDRGDLRVLVFVLQVVWLRLEIGGPKATTAFTDLITVPICAAAAIACWRRARRDRDARAGWTLLGFAVLSWGVGETFWTWYEVVRGIDAPFPSVADIGYLAMT